MQIRKYIPRLLLALYPPVYRLGFRFAWLTRLPVIGRLFGDVVLDTKGSNVSYIPIQENLELPEGMVAPVSIIEHFIRASSHRFIMAYCPCRNANDCVNHPHDIGCIWVGGATADFDLPPEIGRLASVDEAIEHMHIARDAGLITVIGKFKPDALVMGVGNEHKRFMTVCSCCSCCCMVRVMHNGKPEFKGLIRRLHGLAVRVDRDVCVGCGECEEACLFGHISLTDGKPFFSDECKGCGFCALACPNKAISIKIEDPSFIEEAISRISGAVDVT